jgi:phosphoribosylaminoimidazole-succinocarboxamide synthase
VRHRRSPSRAVRHRVRRSRVPDGQPRDYEAGRDPYGLQLPKGLRRDSAFPTPLLTPSTKAPIGQHDEPVSEAQVLERGLITPRDWQRAKEAALGLFDEGRKQAAARGLLFVDTKYEFGRIGDELVVIDELHTPDSSRFWMAQGAEERFAKGEPQVMLDKENLRQWLITERGFLGQGTPPSIPDDVRVSLTQKYVAAFETITGTTFTAQVGSVAARIEKNLKAAKLL